jgi:TrmH family RNA methyltransferase
MKLITSRDNAAFKELRLLAHEPRQQKRQQRTLIEGIHLLAAALEHQIIPELVVLSESALQQTEIQQLLARLPDVPLLALRDALFHEVSELTTPVGLLARIAIPPEIDDLPPGDCLLLDAVQDAGNVGTLLRTAAAAGIRHILLGPGCAGAWSPRVLRAGQGAHFALEIHEAVDLAGFVESYPGAVVAGVAHAGELLYHADLSQPTAWLFGSEGRGIAPELLALTTCRVTIPLAVGSESLNVGAAAAVCLFEMRRQRMMQKVGAGGTAG